jgi:hypothetical protein
MRREEFHRATALAFRRMAGKSNSTELFSLSAQLRWSPINTTILLRALGLKTVQQKSRRNRTLWVLDYVGLLSNKSPGRGRATLYSVIRAYAHAYL